MSIAKRQFDQVSPQENVTATLVDFALETYAGNIPPRVVKRAKQCILDGLGCALGAQQSVLGHAVKAAFQASTGKCTIIGEARPVSAQSAAFVNATIINALDFDDDNGVGHPTATILGALLAAAENHGATGKDMIYAFTCGYEVSTRIGRATWPSPERYAEVWGVGTHQVFGAVIAAGLLAGLSRESLLDAFGIAGTNAPIPSAMKWGWNGKPLSWIKDAVAWPALSAIIAVDLAKAGFRGCPDFLDGRHGFWVMAASDRWDDKVATNDLGKTFAVLSGAFKPYPCCRYAHSTLEAIERIQAHVELDPACISKITIQSLTDLLSYMSDASPDNMIEAQFSIPFLVATMTLRGAVTPDDFSDSMLSNREVLRLASLATIVADPEADAIYNATHSELHSTVIITMVDGVSYEETVRFPKGELQNPITDDELLAKFSKLAEPVLEQSGANELRDMVLSLETIEDVRFLSSKLAIRRDRSANKRRNKSTLNSN